MRFFWLFLSFALPLLSLEEKAFFLESDHALFDGKLLTLQGNTRLHNALGEIHAHTAKLEGLSLDKKTSDMHLHLLEGVEVLFTNKARIECARSHFNYLEKKVSFFSGDKEHKIHYTDAIQKKDGSFTSLQIQCMESTAELKEKLHFRALSFFDLHTLTFLGEVEISLDETASAQGGKAVFKKNSFEAQGKEKNLLGILDLYPLIPHIHCRLCYGESEIFAEKIQFDFINSLLSFKEPKGVLLSPFEKRNPLFFSAKKLSWDKKNGIFLLEEGVELKENGFAHFLSDQIELRESKGFSIASVVARGASEMTFFRETGELPKLICYGIIHLDQESRVVTASAECNGEEEASMLFHDEKITLSAKKATMLYGGDEKPFSPQKITFEDNVRFFAEENGQRSFGIADSITYFPATKKVILASLSPQKVLLWHDDDSLKLSASEIHIARDPKTDTQYAEGLGEVRFTFNPHEESFMKNKFAKFLKTK